MCKAAKWSPQAWPLMLSSLPKGEEKGEALEAAINLQNYQLSLMMDSFTLTRDLSTLRMFSKWSYRILKFNSDFFPRHQFTHLDTVQ